jgi:hypothetical protein
VAENTTALSYEGNAEVSDLTANGNTVAIGPLEVTVGGFDLTGTQAECQLGKGANIPGWDFANPGTDFGFVDTTYTLTPAQIAAGSLMGA